MITEKQQRKWCVCSAWLYSLLGLYAYLLRVMDLQWQSTIATFANSLMMKGTFWFFRINRFSRRLLFSFVFWSQKEAL